MSDFVAELLEVQERERPEKVAFREVSGEVTFGALAARVWRLGAQVAARVPAGGMVGICLPKGIGCLVWMFGVLAVGRAYVLLDPSMPPHRLAKIVRTVSPVCVVAGAAQAAMVREAALDVPLVRADMPGDALPAAEAEGICRAARAACRPEDLAYVMFTSGSTGEPKGVMVSQRALARYAVWTAERLGISSQSVIANQTPFFYALSLQDVFAPLTVGCTTCLIAPEAFVFPLPLLAQLVSWQADLVFWVPSALSWLVRSGALTASPALPPFSRIAFCGEVMPQGVLRALRAAWPQAEFLNLYGSTEMGFTLAHEVRAEDFTLDVPLPLGQVLPPVKAVSPVAGAEGELVLRAEALLGTGYFGRPDASAQRFPVAADGSRLYRTGDVVRRSADVFSYVCREDALVKHQGYRVELGEVEAALAAQPGVVEAACVHDRTRDVIVGFYVPGEGTPQVRVLLSGMRQELPPYMVPERLVALASLPLNAHGKVDRPALLRSVSS